MNETNIMMVQELIEDYDVLLYIDTKGLIHLSSIKGLFEICKVNNLSVQGTLVEALHPGSKDLVIGDLFNTGHVIEVEHTPVDNILAVSDGALKCAIFLDNCSHEQPTDLT